MSSYDIAFYERAGQSQKLAAQIISAEVLKIFPHITSAVDIGCGPGGWLAALKQLGVKTLLGVDGPWVPNESLLIQPSIFVTHDFQESFPSLQRYDLAISLEVAEHIFPERAEAFVDFLTTTSDIILFSAAIPMQGGTNHYNEQWPSYWINLFRKHNFSFVDILRWKFWGHANMPVWYKQNLFLVVAQKIITDNKYIQLHDVNTKNDIFDVVHPELYVLRRISAKNYISDLENKIATIKNNYIEELSIRFLCKSILKKCIAKITGYFKVLRHKSLQP